MPLHRCAKCFIQIAAILNFLNVILGPQWPSYGNIYLHTKFGIFIFIGDRHIEENRNLRWRMLPFCISPKALFWASNGRTAWVSICLLTEFDSTSLLSTKIGPKIQMQGGGRCHLEFPTSAILGPNNRHIANIYLQTKLGANRSRSGRDTPGGDDARLIKSRHYTFTTRTHRVNGAARKPDKKISAIIQQAVFPCSECSFWIKFFISKKLKKPLFVDTHKIRNKLTYFHSANNFIRTLYVYTSYSK